VPVDAPDPQATYELLLREAALYSPTLVTKPRVVVITKTDLLPHGTEPPSVGAGEEHPSCAISAVTGAGIPEFLETLWRTVVAARPHETPRRPRIVLGHKEQ
jgi:GTP-binding protein